MGLITLPGYNIEQSGDAIIILADGQARSQGLSYFVGNGRLKQLRD